FLIVHQSYSTKSWYFYATRTAAFCALSLHDALPIFEANRSDGPGEGRRVRRLRFRSTSSVHRHSPRHRLWSDPSPAATVLHTVPDRKSTRLNSSHVKNSYAVFCLKKKRIE